MGHVLGSVHMCICRVAMVKQAILSNWQALCQNHGKANCLAALSAFPGNAQVVSAVVRAKNSTVFLLLIPTA